MLHTVEIYFLLFMSYSVLGWCMEVSCKLIEMKKFINRGFLIGPYCPIYGWGAITITILLQKYLDDPIALFFFGILICSVLEYLTSFVMEKLFHARWWDYSRRKFNINGRICLNTMIPFGILGMVISYVFNPAFFQLYERIEQIPLNIICASILAVYLVDNIISAKVISSVRVEGRKLEKDNTEEITTKVKEILMSRNWAYKRLIKAYPGLKEIGDIIRENAEKVKQATQENIEKAKQVTQENIEKAKQVTQENIERAKQATQENFEKAWEGVEKIKEVGKENILKAKGIKIEGFVISNKIKKYKK